MRTAGCLGGPGICLRGECQRSRIRALCAAALLSSLSFLLGWVARGAELGSGTQLSRPAEPAGRIYPLQRLVAGRVLTGRVQLQPENQSDGLLSGSRALAELSHLPATISGSAHGVGTTADPREGIGTTTVPTESFGPSGSAIGPTEGNESLSSGHLPTPTPWALAIPLGEAAGLEGEAVAVRRLRMLIQPLAQDNTVIVVPSNLGFLPLALNLRCRLAALKARNVLFWALDRQAQARLTSLGVPNFYDPILTPEDTPNATRYREGPYQRMMQGRPRAWWRVLATGFDMLFLDADTVAFRNWETWFPRVADFEVQLDGFEGWPTALDESLAPHACAGVFWARSGLRTLQLMEEVGAELASCLEKQKALRAQKDGMGLGRGHRKQMRCDDQLALAHTLRKRMRQGTAVANRGPLARSALLSCWKQPQEPQQPQLRVFLQDPRVLLSGHLARKGYIKGSGYQAKLYYKRVLTDKQIRMKPALLHYNGFGRHELKVSSMKKYGWWELDNSGKCRAS